MTHAASVAPHVPASASEARPVVSFNGVSVAFDGPPVLKEVSFSVAPGETRVLLGPAGVGKSVLLKTIVGLIRPQNGRVELLGNDITHMPEENLFPLRARTGFVFQEGALFDSLTVRDNVAYQLIQERVPDDDIDARVMEALKFVGLEQTFNLYSSALSGGMRRRVAIARALIHQPELILYDSPTGGLDPVTSNTIIELIVKQRDVHATPSMLVTHRLQDAFALCDHRFDPEQGCMVPLPKGQINPNTTFLMLEDGGLIFDGSLEELVHSENHFVREFLE